MREILFRAWHTKQKRMYSPEEMAADQLTLLTTGYFINVSGTSTKLSKIDFDYVLIPLQFTGLLDKHGKKIFEGDIFNYGGKRNFVVIFHKGYFCYKSGPNEYHIFDETQVEVIGNIYENPELLKGDL